MTERRADSGRENLVAEIAAAFREEIACLTVPETIHREHHEFIGEWIEAQRVKRDRMEKIKTQVAGWAIVSVLGGIGTGAYHALAYLREHLK